MAFTGMLCRFTISYKGLLLKEHVPRNQVCFNAWEVTAWSIIAKDLKASLLYEIVHVSFLYDRKSLNSECLGSDKDWYFTI